MLSERLAEDRRHWVANPRGHRAHLTEYQPSDGDEVDTPFGKAVVISTPFVGSLDDWVCDLCNEDILTRWGEEPFPVPMFGSYALCMDHYEEVITTWKHDTADGEVSNVPMGPWPLQSCSCPPCLGTLHRWFNEIRAAKVRNEEAG